MTTSTSPTTRPLYQRLVDLAGTEEVVGLVATRLYDRILGPAGGDPGRDGDPELVGYFRDERGGYVDRDRLQRHMTHFLMAALGGPQRYSGRGMAVAHARLGITDAAFDRVIGHVVAVLQGLGVPGEWIAEVGAAVAPLREPIVTAADRHPAA